MNRIGQILVTAFCGAILLGTSACSVNRLSVRLPQDVAGQFDTEKLTAKADVRVTFSRGAGQYAFDAGAEPW